MRVACWQPSARDEDPPTRIRMLADVAARAREAGADLLVTPELSLTGHELDPRRVALAASGFEELSGAVAGVAARAGLAVVFGCPEAGERGVHDTVRLVTAAGAVAATCRKGHLHGREERSVYVPGSDRPAQFDFTGLRVGLAVGYDAEFPEMVRAHALRGTELLVVPGALRRGAESVVSVLLPARAIENGIHVAFANWCGADRRGAFAGSSRILGPDAPLASAPVIEEHLLVADVHRIHGNPDQPGYVRDRRPELYRDLVGGS